MKKLLLAGLLVAGFGVASQASVQIGTGLNGSGALLPAGSPEQNYQVSGNDPAMVYYLGYAWVGNTPTGQWISPANHGVADQSLGLVKYTRTLGAGTINGFFSSDNPGQLLVNGNVIATAPGYPNQDLYTWGIWTPFTAALNQPINTIEFDVVNLGGPEGLIVDGTFTAVPEPSTVIAGLAMLLPFGMSALRSVRKNRA